MRLSQNGFVIDKTGKTFGELKFTAVRDVLPEPGRRSEIPSSKSV